MKASATATLAAIFFFIVTIETFKLYRSQYQRAERMELDLKISRDSCTYFISRDKQNAVKIQVQEYTLAEIRRNLPGMIQAAKNIYVPPRLIQGYTQGTIQEKKEIITLVRDSIIHDTIQVKTFKYQDRFNLVRGVIEKDTAHLLIQSQDTISIFNVQARRNHPWLWILSKRGPDQVIIKNANPDSKIILKQSIMVLR